MLEQSNGLVTARKTGLLIFTVALSAAICNTSLGANPFITSIYTADPSAHVWSDGRLYVYPSRDIDPPRGCDLMDRYHVFSTDDMVHWRDEGEILNASQVSWGRPEGGFMWAPDCAYKNGIYYFYFPHPSDTHWNDTWRIGIATSTKPASDFKPSGYVTGIGGFAMIDPCVFMDTDGQAYLYYGGGAHCAGVKLKPNMTEVDGKPQPMTGLEDFHEATWVFKRNGIYYLTYADNNPGANRMRYATSANPLGPWTYKGIYLDPTDCDTSHGSVVKYKGQWYQFYHNCVLSGRGNLRSICVDKLEFDAEGNILKVIQTTNGVPAVGPAPAPNTNAVQYEAESGSVGNGATIADDGAASGGKCVQNLHLPGSYLQFNAIDGGNNGCRATINIHYASADKAKLRMTVNGVDYSFINTFSTGGWEVFTGDAYETVPLQAGTTNVIRFAGGNGGLNVDYITATPLPTPRPASKG
jgi:beta-xylosidase